MKLSQFIKKLQKLQTKTKLDPPIIMADMMPVVSPILHKNKTEAGKDVHLIIITDQE